MGAFAVLCATDGSLIFYNRDTVPTAGSTFEGKIASNVYTGFDTASYTSASSVPWYSQMDSIISVSFAPEFATVKPISTGYWFSSAANIMSFDGVNLDTSNVTDISYMFYNCRLLTSIDISNFNTSNVTNMSSMFYYCKSIKSLDLSNFDTSKVTNMVSMFQHCSSLTTLDLSSFNTSKVTNMASMFYGCSSLTTIYASKLWDISLVTSINNAFYSCSKLVGAIPYNSSQVSATMANYETGYLTYKFYYIDSGYRYVVSGSDINRIANALRAKIGGFDGLTFPDGFIAAIESLSVAAIDDGSGNVTVGIAGSEITYNDDNVVIS